MEPIVTREEFVTMPIPELQEKIWKLENKELEIFFKYLGDKDWLIQKKLDNMHDLLLRFLCVTPPKCPDEIFTIFSNVIIANNLVPAGSTPEIVYNTVYEHNPEFIKRISLEKYKDIYAGVKDKDPACDEEKHLCSLEVAMYYNVISMRKDLLQEPPLDHKTTRNEDLFTIVCRFGTLDEVEKVLDFYLKKKGIDAIRVYLEDRGGEIYGLIRKMGSDGIKKIIEIYRARGLDPASFVFTKTQNQWCTTLSHCKDEEMFQICYDLLSKDQVVEMTKTFKGKMLFIMLKGSAQLLNQFFDDLKESDISLSELFFYRNDRHNITFLDQVCSNGQANFLKVLLKRISDEDLKKLLFPNPDQFHAPLYLCDYYPKRDQNECTPLIRAEMSRLSQ